MSWRGSTGHIDANVPDYQKMLQSRYPSSGWSSTQSGYPSYTGRSSLGGYLNPRNTSPTYGRSGHGYGAMYQPSKYGLTSASSESLYNSRLDNNVRGAASEDGLYRSDNGYLDKNYGFLRKDYDQEPFHRDYSSDTNKGRGSARRLTDYSSDSGHVNNRGASYYTGYSSDSGGGGRGRALDYTSDSGRGGRGQVLNYASDMGAGERSQVSDYTSDSGGGRGRVLDYTSDSGAIHGRHRRKSSEFELDIPSPDRSQSNRDETDYTSPVKSQLTLSDYLQYSDNQSPYTNSQSKQESMADYFRDAQSPDDNRRPANLDNIEEQSPRTNEAQHEADKPADNELSEEEALRMNFMSPPLYRGNIADTTMAQRDNDRNPVRNLTQWQQDHLSKSKDSHRSHSYLAHHRHTADSSHRFSKNKHHHGNKSRQPDHDSLPSSHHPSSSDQINHIRSAADAIIRDKDAIIDELKTQVVSLEEAVKEYENKLRRTLMTRGAHSGESTSFSKMQDLEYRNSELRSELAKLKLTKDTEIEDLEIKLGGVEHEVVQLKAALRKSQPNASEMKEKIEEKELEIEEWQTKYSRLNKSYEDMKEKLDGLERYLSDLPTIEEFNKISTELTKCREEISLKSEQIGDLEDRLKETTEQLADREVTVQDLRGRQQQLVNKLHDLNTEMKRLKSEGEGKALSQALDELSETKEIKERLAVDLEKAKKLLEMNHRRLRQLEVKHQTDKQQVQERLVQEEESGTALREELRIKEEQVAKLKKSIKEFAGKNQDLMDEGLILKEQIRQFEQMSTDENQKLQRKFVKEMGICFAELQSLVQICIQRAEGKDPNISLLLGMRSSGLDEDEEREGAVGGNKREEQTLKHWFKKLKDLHAEVEKVRKMICNKYAEEMGDNLNCATQ